jgi:VanZ family protein
MKSSAVYARWVVLFAYAGLIFFLSSREIPPGYLPPIPHIDKLAHLIEYALLAVLCFRALWPDPEHPTPFWVLILGVVLTTVYGAADEFHQYFIPTREFSWLDLAADGVGAAIASALWEPVTGKFRRLR